MNQDRRGSARKPVLVKTTLKFNGISQEAVATDWSEHGVFVQTDEVPPVGTAVALVVSRPGQSPLTIRSAVARHEQHPLRGVGLSWVEETLPLLREAFERPAANTETQGTSSAGFCVTDALPLGDAASSKWEAALQSASTSYTEEDPFMSVSGNDPFSSFAEEESLYRAVEQASRVAEAQAAQTSQRGAEFSEPTAPLRSPGTRTENSQPIDWSQLPVTSPASSESNEKSADNPFPSGTAIRYRLEGKWFTGRVKHSDSGCVTINSNWTIPLEGQTVALSAAEFGGSQLRVKESRGSVDRVDRVGAYGRQGGCYRVRLIRA